MFQYEPEFPRRRRLATVRKEDEVRVSAKEILNLLLGSPNHSAIECRSASHYPSIFLATKPAFLRLPYGLVIMNEYTVPLVHILYIQRGEAPTLQFESVECRHVQRHLVVSTVQLNAI